MFLHFGIREILQLLIKRVGCRVTRTAEWIHCALTRKAQLDVELKRHTRIDRDNRVVKLEWSSDLVCTMLVEPRFFDVLADVPEQIMFARQFGVALKMVSYLHEIVAQALKIDVLRSRGPPKMKVTLLQVWSLKPDLCPPRQGFPGGDVVIF